MKKRSKVVINIIVVVLVVWGLLTLWAQYGGQQKSQTVGMDNAVKKALIIYNPDPFYNLDEQVCKSFAEGLSKYGFASMITTTKLVHDKDQHYDLYVFCANTYNWSPDWRVTKFIKNSKHLIGKNVVAITLGSGSTARAKRKLEEAIKDKNANLLGSKTYWLLKPNDEKRMDEKNTAVANDLAKLFGEMIGKQLQQ